MKSPTEMFGVLVAALQSLGPSETRFINRNVIGSKRGTRKNPGILGGFGRTRRVFRGRCTCGGCLKAVRRGGNSNPIYNGF